MQESRRIRVLLAEDHAIVREDLRSLLEKQPDMEVICEAEDGRIAVERARELLPDVVVMDITMPNLNGFEATRKIINEFPQIKIIALSIHSSRRFVANMLEAGATGYVVKEGLLVSTRTVEAISRRIMEKLGVHTLADLVKIAVVENLVALEL